MCPHLDKLLLHSFWHIIWKYIWRIHYVFWHYIWHSCWHILWHSVGNLFGIYSDILSGILSGLCSDIFGTILTFFLVCEWHGSYDYMWTGASINHPVAGLSAQVKVLQAARIATRESHFQLFIWLWGPRVFNFAPSETANAVSMPDLYIYIYIYIYYIYIVPPNPNDSHAMTCSPAHAATFQGYRSCLWQSRLAQDVVHLRYGYATPDQPWLSCLWQWAATRSEGWGKFRPLGHHWAASKRTEMEGQLEVIRATWIRLATSDFDFSTANFSYCLDSCCPCCLSHCVERKWLCRACMYEFEAFRSKHYRQKIWLVSRSRFVHICIYSTYKYIYIYYIYIIYILYIYILYTYIYILYILYTYIYIIYIYICIKHVPAGYFFLDWGWPWDSQSVLQISRRFLGNHPFQLDIYIYII